MSTPAIGDSLVAADNASASEKGTAVAHQEQHGHGKEHHHRLNFVDRTVHRHEVVYAHGDVRTNTWTTWLTAAYMAFCLFTDSFSISVTTAQSTFIARDIGGDRISSWFGNAGLVAATCAYPVAFYISDNIGRKLLMQIGAVMLFVGSLISGRAQAVPQMIVGLVIVGLGVGTLAPCLVGISDVVSVRQRALFLGCLDIGGGLSVMSASLVGGALTSKTAGSWRNCFYLVAALSAAVFLGSLAFHPQYPKKASYWQVLKNLDWIGQFVFVAGIVLLLVGLANPFIYPWSDGRVVGPLVVGAVLLIFALPAWCYFHPDAIIRPSLFTFFNFPFAAFLAWLSGFLLFGFAGFLPSMLTVYYGASAIRVGVLMLVANGIYIIGSPASSASISVFNGSFKPLLFLGFVAAAIGCGVISTLEPTDSVKHFLGMSVAYGIGNAIISSMSLAITQYAVTYENLGIAVGCTNAARTLGGALSLAIFNTILSNRVAKAIPEKVPSALIGGGLPSTSVEAAITAIASGSADAIAAVPGMTTEAAQAGGLAYLQSYKYGFEATFWMAAAFMALGAVCVLFMHDIKPERLTDEVAVPMGQFGSGKEQNNVVVVRNGEA